MPDRKRGVKRLPDAPEVACPHCGGHGGFMKRRTNRCADDPAHEWVYGSCRLCGGHTVQKRRVAEGARRGRMGGGERKCPDSGHSFPRTP